MSDWPRIPQDWVGHTWPYRVSKRDEHGHQIERVVPSRFPPASVGNPGEPVEAFTDFRAYSTDDLPTQNPTWFCSDCGRWLEKSTFDAGVRRCGWCSAGRPQRRPE